MIYLAQHINGLTRFQVCKLFYFADLEHMQKYGRFITDDNYVAMTNDPVPSQTYDLIKDMAKSNSDDSPLLVKSRTITANRQPDMDEFSDSDIECLDYAIHEHGHKPFGTLREDSHDLAWEKATHKSSSNASQMTLENIVDTLPNANELRHYLTSEGQL